MRGLYAIVDLDSLAGRGLAPLPFAAAVARARPAALQLRAKHAGARETLELLRALRPVASEAGALLFANDRVDLAALAGCDGVHLGQHDLDIGDARRVAAALGAPGLRIGLSTHGAAELETALASHPDYVAAGPVFATHSKDQPDPTLGLVGLASLATRARAADTPLVAIGGIDAERAPEVAALVPAAAVIAALLPPAGSRFDADDVTRRAARLGRLLGGEA